MRGTQLKGLHITVHDDTFRSGGATCEHVGLLHASPCRGLTTLGKRLYHIKLLHMAPRPPVSPGTCLCPHCREPPKVNAQVADTLEELSKLMFKMADDSKCAAPMKGYI